MVVGQIGQKQIGQIYFCIAFSTPIMHFLLSSPQGNQPCGIFFALPTFRPMANKKTAENFVVSFFLSIFALQ